MSGNNQSFWKKKTIVSYFLSVLVFMIHISSFSQYASGNSLISSINEKVNYFFSDSITAFAVPSFFILSGIAFFRDYTNDKYVHKIKSRIHTLLIPYLTWNTLWTLFEIICSYTPISNYYIGREPFQLSFINILKGIFLHTCSPFWFIFNLMVFIIFAPVINVIINNKYIGITTVLILSILLIFNIGLPSALFFSADSIIYFLVGAIIGKHFWTYAQAKSDLKIRIPAVIFLSAIVLLKNIFPYADYPLQPFTKTVVLILCSVSFWFFFDFFIDKLTLRPFYTRSFFVYAMHINVSAIVAKLLMFVLPKSEWFAIPNFLLTTVITLILINTFCIITERFFPRFYYLLSGKKPSR